MANSLHVEIGKRIAIRRKMLNLTQEQVAEVLDVSVQMVSNLERGKKAVRLENLIKLSKALDISCDYILTGKRKENDYSELVKKISTLTSKDYNMVEMIVEYCNKK